MVRMGVRERRAPHERGHHAVGLVLEALAELVLDDLPLAIELVLRQAVDRERHAVALQPERQLELVRRHRLLEGGPVVLRVGVEVAPSFFHELCHVPALGHVTRAQEHQMLEEVRQPGARRRVVLRAHVVPEVDRHRRRGVVRREQHLEPVGQAKALRRHRDVRRHRVVERIWRLRGLAGEDAGDEQAGGEVGESSPHGCGW
jgi:hypothetical protein